jgi:carbonic anhydrase
VSALPAGSIDLSSMITDHQIDYYRYDGSLTTPPCSQGVKWHVTISNQDVSAMQTNIFDFALNHIKNFRPAQELNERDVTSYADAV